MNFDNADITGVVLAGGQSKRMGFNKAQAEMHGESMLIRMINKLQKITPTILISSGATSYPNIHWTQIPDAYPQCGPLGGIYSVLKASETPLTLVVSCDIPLVSIALLEYIVSKAKESNALITLPIDCDGQLQMMCAVYHKDVVPFLQQQIDSSQFKMKKILDFVSVEYVEISREHPLYDEYAFMNVNNPANLEEARKLWSNRKG